MIKPIQIPEGEKEIQLQCAGIMNKVREVNDIPLSVASDDLCYALTTVIAAWQLLEKEEQKDKIFELYGEACTDLSDILDYPVWLEATVMKALHAPPITYEPESTEPTTLKAPKVTYTKKERQRLADKFVKLAKREKLPVKISSSGWLPVIQFIADYIEEDYPEACQMLLFSYHRFNEAGEGLGNVYEWIEKSMIEDQEDIIIPPTSGFDSFVMTVDPQSDSNSEGNPSLAMSREEFIAALRIEPDQT